MANHQDILDQISKDHTGKNFHEILGSNSNTIETIVYKAIDKIVSASTQEIKGSVRIVEIPQIVEKIVYVEVEKKSDAETKNSATKTKAEPKSTQSPLKVAVKPTKSPLKSNQKPVKPITRRVNKKSPKSGL